MSEEVIPERWHEAADPLAELERLAVVFGTYGDPRRSGRHTWFRCCCKALLQIIYDPEWDLALYGIEGCLLRPYHMASVVRLQLALGTTKCHQAASG